MSGPGKPGGQPVIIVKKKKGHGHGHHGGAWKLAYADLVTAMMAFFMVMWVIGMDVETGKGISKYFNNPGAFILTPTNSRHVMQLDGHPPPMPDEVDENDLTLEHIELRWARILQASVDEELKRNPIFREHQMNVRVTVSDKGFQVELIEDSRGVFFAPGSSDLTTHGRAMVRALTGQMLTARRPLKVTGQVDSSPVQPLAPAKIDLAFSRARAIHQAMLDAAYPPELCRQVTSRGDLNAAIEDKHRIDNNRVVVLMPFAAD